MRYKILHHDFASGWVEVAYAPSLERAYAVAARFALDYRDSDYCQIFEIDGGGTRYRVAAERRDGVWREATEEWHSSRSII